MSSINIMDKPLLLILAAALAVSLLVALTLQFFYWTQNLTTRRLAGMLAAILIPILAISALNLVFLVTLAALILYAGWGILVASELKRGKRFGRVLFLGTAYFALTAYIIRDQVFNVDHPQVWLLHFPNRIIMNFLIWLKSMGLPEAAVSSVEQGAGRFLMAMNNWAPISVLLGAMIANLALYALARRLFPQFRIPPIPEFRTWRVGRLAQLLLWIPILIGMGEASKHEIRLFASFPIQVGVAFYAMTGLVVLWSFMESWRLPRQLKFFVVMILAFNPITRLTVPIIGLLDFFLDFRGAWYWGAQAGNGPETQAETRSDVEPAGDP